MKKVILLTAIIASVVATTNLQTIQAGERPVVNMILEDDGFVDVKLEDLNEQVQEAVSEFANDYNVTVLQYNESKKITKATGENKEDQSEKTIYLNDEGKKVNLDGEEIETEKKEEIEEIQAPER